MCEVYRAEQQNPVSADLAFTPPATVGAVWRLSYETAGLQTNGMGTTQPRPTTTSTGPAISILVADDFSPWRAKVRDILRARPEWTIAGEASDGQQAVQGAAALHPDIVLLDIGMPILSGIEAAKKIREHSPESKLVFVTQCSDPDIMDVSFQLGAKAYLLKTKPPANFYLPSRQRCTGQRNRNTRASGE